MMNKFIWLGILHLVSSLPHEYQFKELSTTDTIPVKVQTSTHDSTSIIPDDVKSRIIESSSFNPLTGKFSVLNSSLGNSTAGYIIGNNNKRYRVKLKKKVASGDSKSRQENETSTQKTVSNFPNIITTNKTALRSQIKTSQNQTAKGQNHNASSTHGEVLKVDSNLKIKHGSDVSSSRSGDREHEKPLKYKKDEKGKYIGGLKEAKPKQKFRVTTHRTTTTTHRKQNSSVDKQEKHGETRTTNNRDEKENDQNIITSICQILNVQPGDVQLLTKKYFGLDIEKSEDLESFRRLYNDFIQTLKTSPDFNVSNITRVIDLISLKSHSGNEADVQRTALDVNAPSNPDILNETQSLVANLTNFLKPLVDLSVNETKNLLVNMTALSQPELQGIIHDAFKNNLLERINITVTHENADDIEKSKNTKNFETENISPLITTSTESSYVIEPTEVLQVESALKNFPTEVADTNNPSLKALNLEFLPKIIENNQEDNQQQNSVNIVIFNKNKPSLMINSATEINDDIEDGVDFNKSLEEPNLTKPSLFQESDDLPAIIENSYNNLKQYTANKPDNNESPINPTVEIITNLENIHLDPRVNEFYHEEINAKSLNPLQNQQQKNTIENAKEDAYLTLWPKNVVREYTIERVATGIKIPPNHKNALSETFGRSPDSESESTSLPVTKPKESPVDKLLETTKDNESVSGESHENPIPLNEHYYQTLKTANPERDDSDDYLPAITFQVVQDHKNPKISTVTLNGVHHFANENELNPQEFTTELNKINDRLTHFSNKDSIPKEIFVKTILNYQVPEIIRQLRQHNPNINEDRIYNVLLLKLLVTYPQYAGLIIEKLNDLKDGILSEKNANEENTLINLNFNKFYDPTQNINKDNIPIPENSFNNNESYVRSPSSTSDNEQISNMHLELDKILENITQQPNENGNVIMKVKETVRPVFYKVAVDEKQHFENVIDHPIPRVDELNFYQLIYQEMPKLIYQIQELSPESNVNDIVQELLFAFSTLYPQLPAFIKGKFKESKFEPFKYDRRNFSILALIRKVLLNPELDSFTFKIPNNVKRRLIDNIDDQLKNYYDYSYESESLEDIPTPIKVKDNYYNDATIPDSDDLLLVVSGKNKYPKVQQNILLRPKNTKSKYSKLQFPKESDSQSLYLSPFIVPYPGSDYLTQPAKLTNVYSPINPSKPAISTLFSRPYEYYNYDIYTNSYEQNPLPDNFGNVNTKIPPIQNNYPSFYDSKPTYGPIKSNNGNKLISINLKPIFVDKSKRKMPFGQNPYSKLGYSPVSGTHSVDLQEIKPYRIDQLPNIQKESQNDETVYKDVDQDINNINKNLGADVYDESLILQNSQNAKDYHDYNDFDIKKVQNIDTKNSWLPSTEYVVELPTVKRKLKIHKIENPKAELAFKSSNVRQNTAENLVESILDIPTPSFHQYYQEYATNILNTTLEKLRLVLEQNKVPQHIIIDLIRDIEADMIVEIQNPKGDCPNIQIENFIKTFKIRIKEYTVKAGIIKLGEFDISK